MASIRLFGRAYRHHDKKVKALRLRLTTKDLPTDARVLVTDLQLQPGDAITGWVQHSQDRDIQPVERYQWRNGIVHDGMTVIVIADAPEATPARWDVRGASGEVRVGSFDFGHVQGSSSVDGARLSATQGAGITPHLTRRCDIDVPVSISQGRALLTCWFRGLTASDTDLEPEG